MGKVLDIDCLLIQDKDVPSHTVGGLLELAQVDGVRLVHLLASDVGEENGKHQEKSWLCEVLMWLGNLVLVRLGLCVFLFTMVEGRMAR